MNSVPPKISRANHWFAAAVIGMAGIGGMAVLFFFNPAAYHFYPICAFHRLTGLNCPGCGMTRALYALLHGDFLAALRDNALLVLGLAASGLRGLWLVTEKFRGAPAGRWLPEQFVWPLLFVALVFTILRNLPAFSFLSPV
jgi:hypothetical protein